MLLPKRLTGKDAELETPDILCTGAAYTYASTEDI